MYLYTINYDVKNTLDDIILQYVMNQIYKSNISFFFNIQILKLSLVMVFRL